MNNIILDVSYPSSGIRTPPGQVGAFLEDVMYVSGEGGNEAYTHLLRLLGYAITGYTNNQVFVILVGEGSAGKSLLLKLVRLVLGPYYKDVSRDMLVTVKGQKPPSKGAASPQDAGWSPFLVTAQALHQYRRLCPADDLLH
jgi:hypothetical protein